MNAWVERRNVGLFLAGKAVSQSGSALYTFAAGWYVLAQTGSAATFGLTLALGILPMVLVMPLAGILADRLNRKRMVVGMDALNGFWFLGMAIYAAFYGLSLGAIYVTAVVTTVLTTLFSVSLEASKLALVSEGRLMSLNASSRVVESMVSVAGPVFGGLVYAWIGVEAFLWINGISFLLSAVSESWMRYEGAGVKADEDAQVAAGAEVAGDAGIWCSLRGEFSEGLRLVWSDSGMRSLAWRLMAINFFIGFCVSVPLPYVLHRSLEGGEKVLGLVQGASPVGVILGAVLIGRLKWGVDRAMKAAGVVLVVSFMILGGLMGVMAWQGVTAAGAVGAYAWMGLIPGMLLLGIGIAWIDLPLLYYFQVAVPEHMKGRVLSVIMSLAKLVLPVALLGAGVLVGRVPAGVLTLAGGVFYLVTLLKDWGKLARETGGSREEVGL
ncbi:MFS transporter [Acidaminobacter hydrogenoformans]|uniref:Major Facilitator Superfamily protein n=1 Tax=Acidaminobacter hydrogenoformans DSM 2784 TaxID=1120920 RepID=A0A1G5RT44_9FIRM|nr:MFS transporter [Acidaminobacter hydrogenoformans]SCZ76489.1 Major Facilitator Superfamily protein [Acidaminobacter hydrogenoformans DSM 2784]